jgi:hypothetical protein
MGACIAGATLQLRRATGPLYYRCKASIYGGDCSKKKLMVEIRPFPLERGAKRDPDNVFLKKRSG